MNLFVIDDIYEEYNKLKKEVIKFVNDEDVRLTKKDFVYFVKLDGCFRMIRGDIPKSKDFIPTNGTKLRNIKTKYGNEKFPTFHGRIENKTRDGLGRRIYWINSEKDKLVVVGILTHDEQDRLGKVAFEIEDKDYPEYKSNIESILKNKKLFSVKGLGDLYSGDYNNDESILVYMRVDEISDNLLNDIPDKDKRRYLFLDISDLYENKEKCYLYFEITYSEYQNLSGDSIEYLILNHESDLWLSKDAGNSKPEKFKLDDNFYQYLENKQNELIYIKSYKIKESIEVLLRINKLFEFKQFKRNYRFTKLYKKELKSL